MRIVASSPCRVDLAGGTLDIWPLYLNHPGAVTVNFAVTRYTHCRIETVEDPHITLRSEDQRSEDRFGSLAELRSAEHYHLPLPAYVIRYFAPPVGFTMSIQSEAPAGAGIAGSSALIISIASALNRLSGTGYSIEKLREISQNIEAQLIRVPTGCQDYYPALYGSVNAVEMGPGGIHRKAIDIDIDDFNRRIVLAYTGEPRNSGINNWEVTKAYIDGDRKVHRNFERITAIAIAMRAAIAAADWQEAGRLLREEWAYRRKNIPTITTPLIDRLIAVTRRAGALGGKVCGAGGGGCVFFLTERGAQEKVARAVQRAGAQVLPVEVARSGVRVRVAR